MNRNARSHPAKAPWIARIGWRVYVGVGVLALLAAACDHERSSEANDGGAQPDASTSCPGSVDGNCPNQPPDAGSDPPDDPEDAASLDGDPPDDTVEDASSEPDADCCGSAVDGSLDGAGDPQFANSLVAIAGNHQEAAAGTVLPEALVVQALGEYDDALSGHALRFRVTAGGGSVSPIETTSDADGYASASWTLGTSRGTQQLVVEALDATGAVVASTSFDASAVSGPAARIVVASGSLQTADIGQTLPQPVVASVTDAHGNPVAGTAVHFDPAQGSTAPGMAVTDAQGLASTNWTLGGASLRQSLTATAANVGTATFLACVFPGASIASIDVVSGDEQIVASGTQLAQPIVFRAKDAAGAPLAGQLVELSTYSAGTMRGGEWGVRMRSDENGYIRIQHEWQITRDREQQALYALALRPDGTGAQLARAVASVLPGPPARLVLGQGHLTRAAPGQELHVTAGVADQYGLPIPGVAVTFSPSPGGSVSSSESITASSTTGQVGEAHTTWSLGPALGLQTVTASVPGLPSVTFEAFAATTEPPTVWPLFPPPGVLGEATQITTGLRLQDGFVGLPGWTVRFKVLSGGGSLVASEAVSDADGAVTTQWVLGPNAGEQQVQATIFDLTGNAIDAALLTASSQAAPPFQIAVASGNQQSGEQGRLLAQPVVVQVTGKHGYAAPPQVVRLTAAEGGFASVFYRDDTSGRSFVRWVLGPPLGRQTLEARADITTGVATFEATALPAFENTTVVMTKLSGEAQSTVQHARLTTPLRLRVTDDSCVPLPDVGVNFTGGDRGGYARPASALTNHEGLASYDGYFHVAGEQRVDAEIARQVPATFSFQVTPTTHPFDGVYACTSMDVDLHIDNGGVGLDPEYEWINRLYSSSLDETDGSLQFLRRDGLDYRQLFEGQISIDDVGRATASGRMYRVWLEEPPTDEGVPVVCERR